MPSKRPLWIDFGDGSVPFWELFAQPGLVSAAANFRYPPQIRAKGGSTIYFDLNFHRRLGSPAKPKPLDEVLESANRLFFYAAASSGCNRPWIALNELFGANLPRPGRRRTRSIAPTFWPSSRCWPTTERTSSCW